MKDQEIENWWNSRFPKSPPLGFLLRAIYREQWFRIHSLPQSMRYADTDGEYAELLNRHNTVAGEVLGEGAACFMIHGFWIGSNAEPSDWIVNPDQYTSDTGKLRFEQRIRFELENVTWRRSQFDDLVLAIADWKVTMVLWTSKLTGNVYAPYDGGADLIFANEQECVEQKRRFHAWLSNHPDGL